MLLQQLPVFRTLHTHASQPLGPTRMLCAVISHDLAISDPAVMQAYYQMSYVDRRIGDAEHVLCDDVQHFTSGLADLTSELTSAVIDALFYGTALRIQRGTHAYLAAMAAYIISAGTLTAALAPNFSRLVSKTQELESQYKASQARPRSLCPTHPCIFKRATRKMLPAGQHLTLAPSMCTSSVELIAHKGHATPPARCGHAGRCMSAGDGPGYGGAVGAAAGSRPRGDGRARCV